MYFYETLLKVFENLKEMLPLVLSFYISFSLILFAFRIFKSLTGPFGKFDSFSGFLGSESKESKSTNKDVVILESCVKHENKPYKINLSKDKSGR